VKTRSIIVLSLIATCAGVTAYLFLYGKLFAFSPAIVGFVRHESANTVVYVQNGAEYSDFTRMDTLTASVERFHELKFTQKPEIFIFRDSVAFRHRSLSTARFCTFPRNRVLIAPWALNEARRGEISLEIYLRHELSHALIFEHADLLVLIRFAYPEWLLEGIATFSADQMGTSFYPGKAETYHLLSQGNFMPPQEFQTKSEDQVKLNVKYRVTFMYSEFACIVDYLISSRGKEKFLIYMNALMHDTDYERVFRQVYGLDFETFLTEFKQSVAKNDSTGNTIL
jgi:predicted SprT family Zn-dependent metalloprotease